MAIPFFGPFVAWVPPVLVAVLARAGRDCCRPSIVMAVGWLVVMNVLQPRLMQEAVGIHPIVVLGSVLIGSKVAGDQRRDLRHPDRRGPVGVLLPLPRPDPRAVAGRRPGGPAASRRARAGRSGSRASRSPGRSIRTWPTSLTVATRRRSRRRRGRPDGAGDEPDMTRERARVERRDLDKERGEPVAGGAARGGPRALRPIARPLRDWSTRPRILDHERRRRRVARAARAEAGARPDRRHDGRRARHEPERGRPPEDAHAPAPRPGADARPTARSPTRSTARPTDAVSLAFLGYFGHGFDLVASGINYGANLGDDITYSGTVSAAMEAVINGCPAFAISQEYYEHPDFDLAGLPRRPSSPGTSSSTACRAAS